MGWKGPKIDPKIGFSGIIKSKSVKFFDFLLEVTAAKRLIKFSKIVFLEKLCFEVFGPKGTKIGPK